MSTPPILACDRLAMTTDERALHAALLQRLRPDAGLEELPDGFALVFEPSAERALALTEFMSLERLCCPFLDLEVAFAREAGPLRLRLTGPDGVKPFLVHELCLEQISPAF